MTSNRKTQPPWGGIFAKTLYIYDNIVGLSVNQPNTKPRDILHKYHPHPPTLTPPKCIVYQLPKETKKQS